jgi:hypothetical protein
MGGAECALFRNFPVVAAARTVQFYADVNSHSGKPGPVAPGRGASVGKTNATLPLAQWRGQEQGGEQKSFNDLL